MNLRGKGDVSERMKIAELCHFGVTDSVALSENKLPV